MGMIPPPHWADNLIQTLKQHTGGLDDAGPGSDFGTPQQDYAFSGYGSSTPSLASVQRKKSLTSPFSPASWGKKRSSSTSYFPPQDDDTSKSQLRDDLPAHSRSASLVTPSTNPFKPQNENIWGESPQSPWQHQKKPSNENNQFDTYFESDFAVDQSVPSGRKQELHNKQNLPELTTPLNAFSFDTNTISAKSPTSFYSPAPAYEATTGDGWYTKAPSPSHNRKMSSSSPYRSPSPVSPTSSMTHNSTSSKPTRVLSKKRGLNEPGPDGSVRAIALFDFLAKEVCTHGHQ